MILNETQHRLIQDPKVQLLIEAFQAEPVDQNINARAKIANRCEKLLQEAQSNASAPKVEANPESVLKREETVSTWILEQTRQFGAKWCPFCIALLISIAVGLTWRQAVAYSPVAAQDGQSKSEHRGASLPVFTIFKHNACAKTEILTSYRGQKHLFKSVLSDSEFNLAEF